MENLKKQKLILKEQLGVFLYEFFLIPRLKSMYGDKNIISLYSHVEVAYFVSWLKRTKNGNKWKMF